MPEHITPRQGEFAFDGSSGTLDQHRVKALRVLLLAASFAAPTIALALFLRDGITLLTMLVGATSVLLWVLGWLLHRGRVTIAAHGLVLLILTIATVTTVITGGVRSAGVFVLLSSMVLASTFLSRKKMIAVVLYCILALGLINWFEQRGMLPGTLPPTGWTVWVVQVVVIGIVLISALAGQYRLQEAFDTQKEALRLAYEAEAALKESQERFKALFRNNPVPCLVQSLDSRVTVDVNDAYALASGFSRSDLVGQQPPNLWANPAEEQAFRNTLKAHGRVSGMHARGLRRDGSQFDSLVYAELIQQGKERLMIGMVVDMSAEEKSRRALLQSEARFSKAFRHSPICMTLTRLSDGRYLEVNDACEHVFGGRPEEYVGKTSLETGVWPSQQVRKNYVNTMLRDGRLTGYETQVRNRKGELVEVKVWAEIIDIEGEACALSFVLNVAEERRRRSMLMNLAEGVSPKIGQAFFLSVTEHMVVALGATSVVIGETAEGGGINTLGLTHNGDLQPNRRVHLHKPSASAMMASDGLCVIELPAGESLLSDLPFADGHSHTVAGIALRDPDGTAIGLLAVAWEHSAQIGADIQALTSIFASRSSAELMRLRRDLKIQRLQDTLEQRVQARTEQLQHINRELDSFAYSVSHDLKSPLRSIDGFMHVLREQMGDRVRPEDDAIISRVMASASRMGGLIKDLLALARVSQTQLQRSWANLSEMADEVIRQERQRDPENPVEVVIEPELFADCDPHLAQIALENLLGNAWKYSRNTPQPRIEFGRVPASEVGAPTFFVRDNGAGFDMSRSDRLFKPFTRLHQPSEFQGSGIGLATVHRIIERHGGHIHGKGEVGRGAVFQFMFGRTIQD
ncbi:PAS domain S-box protein [Hydrogenophaga sp.]|uniref:PAS domain-containing sensor histidine kinase n=1 Tax=Hydrogenophaga sp. TaxID=1904254 RepID=UPI002621B841|nr:PAS domain S-box protein [Hydrogenophaga sp.]